MEALLMLFEKLQHWLLPAELKQHIDEAPKPLGSLDYDRWGYHKETAYNAAVIARLLY